MKKLVTAFAACALAGLAFAQVESVNIVGYQTLTPTGKYYSSGCTFVSVGSATGEWTLGDVTASGMDPFADFIQFLSPATAGTVLQATYIDSAFSQANTEPPSDDLVGWWDPTDLGGTSLDAEVLAAGTGFLCNFSSTGVELLYAGEVLTGATTLDLSGLKYPMIANLTPVDLTLGDVTAAGVDPFVDFIQFLSPTTAGTILQATYIDSAFSQANTEPPSDDLVGWWDPTDLGGTSLNDTALPAGSAVLGNFSSTGVTLTFPDPIQ